ncbi:MAG: hypothetical protein K8W52_28590 [Deltaproteobacteria bacterium]|nr:hypothetical protein [Deltaproteobacteria bacterium]
MESLAVAASTTPSELSPAAEVSWMAIRQPAVIRFLESRLWSDDGDALAAGLELSCRVLAQLAQVDGVQPPRLHIRQLDYGAAAHMTGRGDPALSEWAARALEGLPIMLEALEARRVIACVAAILGAALEARAAGVDDERVG